MIEASRSHGETVSFTWAIPLAPAQQVQQSQRTKRSPRPIRGRGFAPTVLPVLLTAWLDRGSTFGSYHDTLLALLPPRQSDFGCDPTRSAAHSCAIASDDAM